MHKLFLICVFGLLLFGNVKTAIAEHLVGGEIFYDCLGPDPTNPGNFEYVLSLKIYRDCHSTGPDLDSLVWLTLYDENNNILDTILISRDTVRNIPYYVDNPCLVEPIDVCVEEGFYSTNISLPGGMGDFTITAQRCCRNQSIVNIIDPDNTGSTNSTIIKDPTTSGCNSSPRFIDFPPLAICSNYPINFNHAATDPDGDSLVYEFCTPFEGGSLLNPQPYPGPPPYSNVTWVNGFSANFPLIANPPMNISSTGYIDGIPTALGQYVVGVCVQEYRNGQLLSTTFRDFQFNVVDCDPLIVADFKKQQEFCIGKGYQFVNESSGASAYHWDFGVDSLNTDTTSAVSPFFTFPDTGIYSVKLIADPSLPCSDSITHIFEVRDSLTAFFEAPEAQCLIGNEFHFVADGDYQSNATFEWNFTSANINSSNLQNPIVSYSSAGVFPVVLTIRQNGCESLYTDSVEVVENPSSDFEFDKQSGCVPLKVSFQQKSQNADAPTFVWEMGKGNFREGDSLSYTFQQAGNYTVRLSVINRGKCKDTAVSSYSGFTVFPLPEAAFTVDKTQASEFDSEINITDASTNATKVEFHLLNGEILEGKEHFYTFQDTGRYQIMQVSYNDHGCSDTSFREVYIYEEYNLHIPTAFTPNSDRLNDVYKPYVSGVKEYLFQIFNRWGELIFVTQEIKEGWNGYRQDMSSTMGNYIYKIETIDMLGNKHSHVGNFQLIR